MITEENTKNEIRSWGFLYYLLKKDENAEFIENKYEPISFEYWKMLRSLEPTKIANDYEYYVKLKEEQHLKEEERRKNCTHELNYVFYNLCSVDYLEKTRQSITEVQLSDRFEKWIDNELVQNILNS
jgi:hypothetical protein